MQNIRQANINDSEALTDLAVRSEAYWDYDDNFMKKFKEIYRVTEEFIINNPTFVLEENNCIIGFYGIFVNNQEVSLEYLFIEPEKIGKGYGKLLWNYMVDSCQKLNANKIIITTSPQVKEFYIKMDAIYVGDVDSLCEKDRKIPKLIYSLGISQSH